MKLSRSTSLTAAVVFCAAGLAQAQSFSESFDDITTLPGADWFFQNNSVPGLTDWFQGNLAVFPPAATSGYIGTNYNNTSNLNTISNWMVLPTRTLQNGQVLEFFTRTVEFPGYPDRLQVRMSTSGISTNVGTLPEDVGDFGTLLLDINANYTLTEYPSQWTLYTVTLSGLPAGGVSGRLAFRYFVEGGGPLGANSDYIGIDQVVYDMSGAVGACCLADGSCLVATATSCSALGGVYSGNGSTCGTANCPQPGACCLPDGTCIQTLAPGCTNAGGVYRGNGTSCASANCPLPPGAWVEQGDAGDIPGTAQVTTGSGALNSIRGTLAAGDVDMYKITICDAAAFTAIVGGDISDTQIFLFDSAGNGVAANDDSPLGAGLLSALAPAGAIPGLVNGTYYLAISSYDNDALDGSGQEIWLDTPFGTVRAPDGLGAANPVAGWDGAGSNSGNYTIDLTGSCYGAAGGPACYANCDNSTSVPFLNVNDFICFQTKFAAGDTYANCDNSTSAPVLNVNDFICFQTKFAAGCSAP